MSDIESKLVEQRMNEKADEARNEKAGEPPRDASWRSLIQPRDIGHEGVSVMSKVDTGGHLPDCASMRNRFGAPLASCNCVELMHQARAALEGAGYKVPNVTQCAKCGMDVHGEELCGWCEAEALRREAAAARLRVAELERERVAVLAELAELRTFGRLHDARAETIGEQSDRIRQLSAALASAYRHHCVVECVSEDDGCTCSDFDVVRAALARQ